MEEEKGRGCGLGNPGMSKAFGGLQAVHNFDLQVKQKDLIGIIGPNGAGRQQFSI